MIKTNGSELKILLLKKGMNYTNLSKNVDVGSSYLSLIANNRRSPSKKLALRIAEFLEVPVEQIFEIE
ncbi:helix-turn-helix transcriptional regulator [Macrococcus caseolyticus]|uniref:helix-turn-helix transcriptional regulator n=1 Tax=Macrococcoides caseolyticum TaxID=69966 RepID=UPI0024BCD4F8|nr:helix-turn-helix transcriptional regulator [Macrococcus caseolyticus]MDJ1154028.1 helix-turn-helix transcriptional regulator [Macrococcus caseolyticus]